MEPRLKACLAMACVAAAGAVAAPTAGVAQEVADRPYQQAISANPFGLLLAFFNAEFERVATESSTVGIGGSYISIDDDDYGNLDAFWRYYPQGDPMDGWAFGTKAGLTRVDGGTYFGAGFDVNRSWLLGKNDNFYVGIGIGLKRLIGTGDDSDFGVRFIPTIRLVNVGFAF